MDATPDALAFFARPRPDDMPAVIVAIPITPEKVLMCWYLTPHPAVDRAIAENHWHTFVVPPDVKTTGDEPKAGPTP